jgi:hypothetical protein
VKLPNHQQEHIKARAEILRSDFGAQDHPNLIQQQLMIRNPQNGWNKVQVMRPPFILPDMKVKLSKANIEFENSHFEGLLSRYSTYRKLSWRIFA